VRIFDKITVLFISMFMTLAAMGGSGSGGGIFGKTRLMLQSFNSDLALLTFEGSTNIPESETTPKLVIPSDEYKDFVAEVYKEVETGKPFVLPVELEDGSIRNFKLGYSELGKDPLFVYLIEIKAEDEKYSE
jgi:hypothetical protein